MRWASPFKPRQISDHEGWVCAIRQFRAQSRANPGQIVRAAIVVEAGISHRKRARRRSYFLGGAAGAVSETFRLGSF